VAKINRLDCLFGASITVIAAFAVEAPAQAQNALPPVVVEQPTRPAARAKPVRQQATRSSATRRAATRGTPAAAAPAAAVSGPARAETATGPVQGYLAGQSATGMKTDTPLRETAQSITVVTADRIADQGATNIQETLRYVPGVFADAYGFDTRGDYPKIRGQDPAIFLDGTRAINGQNGNEWRQDPFMLERVEVFRGPSVLYGDSSVAGLINLISKRPRADGFNEIGVQFDSLGRKQVQLDSTGKLTKDGEWLYRFVGVFRDGHTQTDYVADDRILLAPSLTWRPTTDTNWTVQGIYQKDKTGTGTNFLPHEGMLYPGPNGLIPISRFVGDPNNDLYQTETAAVGSIFEHSFGDAVKFTQNLRFAHTEGIYRSAYADSFSADPFLDPARRTVGRYTYSSENVRDSLTMDNNLVVKFLTGAIQHKVLVGTDYREIYDRIKVGYGYDATPFDLYAPVYTSLPSPAMTDSPNARQYQLGLYAQDQLRFGPWLATVAMRQDFVGNRVVGSPDEDSRATTGRASLMYETAVGFNPYVTYAQSFTPIFGSNVCAEICKAQRGEIYEVGFKYNPFPGTAINGAVFDTVEKNRLAASPDNPFIQIQTGQVRIRGVELEVITKVTSDLNLIGAYTYLDAKVESGDNAGKHIETVPEQQASLWATYRLSPIGLRDVTIGSGVRYIGVAWDGTDTLQVPDYTLFDAMIKYETGPWRLQINASNLADKRHMTACLARGDCFPGMGRTVLGSATYRF
jgi:iron complex outermembrane receptor protein